jgi:hypothetical protein
VYFRFNYVTVFGCISVTIIVTVNEINVFPLTGISVTVIVNGNNTDGGLFSDTLCDDEQLKRKLSNGQWCDHHEPCVNVDRVIIRGAILFDNV